MRLALAQINPIIGDIAGNAQQIRQSLEQAHQQHADLVVFPELSVIGYPPKDLLLKPAVVEECIEAVEQLATLTGDLAALIGYPCPAATAKGRELWNVAALCRGGRIVHRHIKRLLPTYDVFDELRYFEPGPAPTLSEHAGFKLGVSICEDLWNDPAVIARQLYHTDPMEELAALGAQMFINCSASPFVMGKHEFRLKLLRHAAQRYRLPIVYCNQVGGNDELVFDGNSCVVDASGQVIAHARGFETDLLIVDLPFSGSDQVAHMKCETLNAECEMPIAECQRSEPLTSETPVAPMGGRGSRRASALSGSDQVAHADANKDVAINNHDVGVDSSSSDLDSTRSVAGRWSLGRLPEMETLYRALVLGLRDYCRKCGFQTIVLGLSGGIDSALTAVLAAAAVGPEHVRGVAMPSRFSSDHSVADARELASRLGIKFHIIPITEPHQAFEQVLTPHFEARAPDTTEENIQARIRGVMMMAFSNKFGSLLVTTGNKSELAVGYCTLYGDMCGGLAVISDVPKTLVWELSRWINHPDSSAYQRFARSVIPERSIEKVPSAELRPNQTDQDSLPPYDVLDQIVERYVEREQTARQIVAECPHIDPALVLKVVKMIDVNEYKRKQAAPGLKVTGRAFGFGRRMPIAQRYDNRRTLPK